jgi:PhnB protein
MSNVKAIPEGYHSITPSIVCRNAAKAIEFYKEILHAKEKVRMTGPGGLIMHAELLIGDSHLMLCDEMPGMATAPVPGAPTSFHLFVYTDDVDTVFNRAVQAGCKVEMPLENQFWGDRYGKLRDPFGYLWGLAQHVEDVPREEMKKRSEAFAAQMAKGAAAGRKA